MNSHFTRQTGRVRRQTGLARELANLQRPPGWLGSIGATCNLRRTRVRKPYRTCSRGKIHRKVYVQPSRKSASKQPHSTPASQNNIDDQQPGLQPSTDSEQQVEPDQAQNAIGQSHPEVDGSSNDLTAENLVVGQQEETLENNDEYSQPETEEYNSHGHQQFDRDVAAYVGQGQSSPIPPPNMTTEVDGSSNDLTAAQAAGGQQEEIPENNDEYAQPEIGDTDSHGHQQSDRDNSASVGQDQSSPIPPPDMTPYVPAAINARGEVYQYVMYELERRQQQDHDLIQSMGEMLREWQVSGREPDFNAINLSLNRSATVGLTAQHRLMELQSTQRSNPSNADADGNTTLGWNDSAVEDMI